MNCTICDRPAPDNPDEMIATGWIPYYYSGPREMPVVPTSPSTWPRRTC